MGIDLIWFGVLLCVNMQTSFMHPPFGFALFYLRGIAPKSVKSSDIYLGSIPWVLLQLLLVAVLIFWPGMVTMWLDKAPVIDLDKIHIEVPDRRLRRTVVRQRTTARPRPHHRQAIRSLRGRAVEGEPGAPADSRTPTGSHQGRHRGDCPRYLPAGLAAACCWAAMKLSNVPSLARPQAIWSACEPK